MVLKYNIYWSNLPRRSCYLCNISFLRLHNVFLIYTIRLRTRLIVNDHLTHKLSVQF